MSNKIIRSLCYYTDNPGPHTVARLQALQSLFESRGFALQTLRIACPDGLFEVAELEAKLQAYPELLLSIGHLEPEAVQTALPSFRRSPKVFFHRRIDQGFAPGDWPMLQSLWRKAPLKSFHLAFNACCPASSPFFPSARYEREGFSVGLQSTNLAAEVPNFKAWLQRQQEVWLELADLLAAQPDALGIDSSIAPLGRGAGSLVHWLEQWLGSWEKAVQSSIFMDMTAFIRAQNPWPVGLCGLMLPCLEDFQLAEQYEKGAFSLERNLFLSLHCGLGIDTYPAPLDTPLERLQDLGEQVRRLALKYQKCLSIRLIADGKSQAGQVSDFQNHYLQDAVLQTL